MPRFHLHVHNGMGLILDEEGQLFEGLDDAERRAVEGARSIMSTEVLEGSLDLTGYIDIATPAGAVLRTIAFSDAIRCKLGPETR